MTEHQNTSLIPLCAVSARLTGLEELARSMPRRRHPLRTLKRRIAAALAAMRAVQ